MYKLTLEFQTIEELQQAVSSLSGAADKPKKAKKETPAAEEGKKEGAKEEPAKTDAPVVDFKKHTKPEFKLANEDGTPLDKEDEKDKAKEYLRAKIRPINQLDGGKHMDRTREAVAAQGGAKSITVMDAKYYVPFNAILDELTRELITK